MSPSRRSFIKQTSALGVLHLSSRAFAQMMGHQMMGDQTGGQTNTHIPAMPPMTPAPAPGPPMLHSLTLKPFAEVLPLPEVVRPVLKDGRRRISITMSEIKAKVHPDVPATSMWSYGATALGPLVEARAGEPFEIEWINKLPEKHFLPIDHSLHGCGTDVPEVRTVAHMHGAKTQSKDDGYPEDWFVPGKSLVTHYPVEQEATALWYHDHAMGINRLNVYAGLYGMMLLRDKVEDALHLPSGAYELPLIFCDRNFTADGQLFYDSSDDPTHPWIPEFSADALLVNGKLRPYFDAEPTLYRLRMLNVSNSRFFNLSLSNNAPLVQIGTDQGLLPAPVSVAHLSLAPGERADVLLDLSSLAGDKIQLRTGPLGIVEFRVAAKSAKTPSAPVAIPRTLRPVERTPESAATVTRTITLHEYKDDYGKSMVMYLNRKHWHEPTTEKPKLNSTEIWEFVNLTEDTHPMHLHLVRFQILDRRQFDTTDYLLNKKLRFLDEAKPAAGAELGWKDVVQCPSGMITRIIARFEGYTGKYLYHCHILEHEANDMMRPFEVIA